MKIKTLVIILFIIFCLCNILVLKDNFFNKANKTEVWQNPQNLTVYIEENKFKSFALDAFKQWDKKTGNKINFQYINSPQNSQIELRFIQGFENNSTNQAGITHIYSENNYIKKAKILICLKDPITKKDMEAKIINHLTLHEIAHALGIIEHSDDRNDILYPTTDTVKTGVLSKRDIKRVLKIY